MEENNQIVLIEKPEFQNKAIILSTVSIMAIKQYGWIPKRKENQPTEVIYFNTGEEEHAVG